MELDNIMWDRSLLKQIIIERKKKISKNGHKKVLGGKFKTKKVFYLRNVENHLHILKTWEEIYQNTHEEFSRNKIIILEKKFKFL